MNYKVSGNDIIFNQPDFSLDDTLDCGQSFRWNRVENEYKVSYDGYFLNHHLLISENNTGEFILHNVSEDDFLDIWADYFDLGRDYGEIKKYLAKDETLKKACEFAGGIRLLNQDKWEMLCSFIISQNNNIPRIKGIITRLCECFGAFPTAEQLAVKSADELSFLRAGFRIPYILDAAQKVASGEILLDEIAIEKDYDTAQKQLMTIKGVGPKVANCVLLFGMHRIEAFPVDVWIKRVLETYYSDGFPEFAKSYGGIAQQYLFHYIRNADINYEEKIKK